MKHWGRRIAGVVVAVLVALAAAQGWTGSREVARAMEEELSGQTPDAFTLEHLANDLADRGFDVTIADVSGDVKVHEQLVRIRVTAPVTVLYAVPIRIPVRYRAPVDPEGLDLDAMRARGWAVTGVTPALNLR